MNANNKMLKEKNTQKPKQKQRQKQMYKINSQSDYFKYYMPLEFVHLFDC